MTRPLVVVTGASRGIGAALVRHAPSGARVVGVARSALPEGLACEWVRADLATPAGWQRLAALFAAELPKHADAAVTCWHNAGTLDPIGFAGEVDPERYARAVLLDAASPAIVGDAFLRAFHAAEPPSGVLAMIGSGAGSKPYPGWSAYCAGKAALEHWVRTAGLEQARRGSRCRVVAIAPGVVDTEMQEEIRRTPERDFPEVERFRARYQAGGLRDPDDTARELWRTIEDEGLASGAVVDLREPRATA